jgi:hypothetical protein
LKVNRLFVGTYRLRLHGRRISRARYQRERRRRYVCSSETSVHS